MSFQQGLSGLNASSKNLEVIGNNVANANTVGFKSSRAEFSNLYANANSAAAVQIGIGTSVQAVTQQFDQGNLSVTSNPLDVAINGQGLFRVQTNGSVAYTRNGQFKVDRVVCAVDCGLAVNPDVIRAQMEGGIGFGLGSHQARSS